MGMLKEVNQAQPQAKTVDTQSVYEAIPTRGENLPPDYVLRYFGVDYVASENVYKDLKQIHEILINMTPEVERSEGFLWKRLSDLEGRLGQPRIGEKPHAKVLAYLTINRSIRDLEAKKEALLKR